MSATDGRHLHPRHAGAGEGGAQTRWGRVGVGRGIPEEGEEPLISLAIRQPARISSGGAHVLATSSETNTIDDY